MDQLTKLREELLDSAVCLMDKQPNPIFPIVRIKKVYSANHKPKSTRCPYKAEYLAELYEKSSRSEMAKILKTTPRVVKYWLMINGVKLREEVASKRCHGNGWDTSNTESQFSTFSKRKFQNSHNNRHVTSGYVFIYNPSHPKTNNYGYVREHVHVVEAALHRYLKNGELVHHINKNRADNRLENLALFASNAEHMSFHCAIEDWGFFMCGFTGKEPERVVKFDAPVFWSGQWINELDVTKNSFVAELKEEILQ